MNQTDTTLNMIINLISRIKFPLGLIIIMVVWTELPGQCDPDRHSTDAVDGWISCLVTPNPGNTSGSTHWIKYDFGTNITMHDMHIWNMNHPDYLDDGVKDIVIEYSLDNNVWIMVDTFTCPRANASAFYQGFKGPDLNGINARYLLITPINNYGGGCFSMGELRINTGPKNESEFKLEMLACENDGVYQNLTGDLGLSGVYSGNGVTDNGDETFDFDALIAGAGTHLISYNYSAGIKDAVINVLPCGEGNCRECDECSAYDQTAVNANPIPDGTYYGHQLNAAGNVTQNTTVTFWGGNAVELNANFQVQTSGSFEASIRTCYSNELMNPSFENDQENWRFIVSGTAAASISFPTSNPYQATKSAALNVTTEGNSYGNVLLRYENLSIEAGAVYRVSFAARASNPGLAEFEIEGESNPRTEYIDADLEMTPNWNMYAFEFIADSDRVEDVRLQFRCGRHLGDYYFDRVSWARID